MICRGKWAIAFKLYIADELKCFRFIHHQSASLEADSAYFSMHLFKCISFAPQMSVSVIALVVKAACKAKT